MLYFLSLHGFLFFILFYSPFKYFTLLFSNYFFMTLYTHFLSSLQHLGKFSSILYLFRGFVCQDLAFHATEAGPVLTRIKCLATQQDFLKEAHIHMQQALGLPERLRFLHTLTLKMLCKKITKPLFLSTGFF